MSKLLGDLDKGEEKELRNEVVLDVIVDILKIILCTTIFIAVILFISKKTGDEIVNLNSTKIVTATVKDLYKKDHLYYMTVFNENTRVVYNVEVNQSDFTKYKIDDDVKIIVYSNTKTNLYEGTW